MFGLTPLGRNQVSKRHDRDFFDFYNMLDDFFNDNPLSSRFEINSRFKMDVKDKGSFYLIEAELPGISREEIKLDYQDSYLIISINKNEEINDEKENYIHKERRTTSMQRNVYLRDVDVQNIEAKLEDGILKISLPKLEQKSDSLQIEIK
ncbi:MAG: Hsp20/alpha crystallin family protein [Proteocatella sp.]